MKMMADFYQFCGFFIMAIGFMVANGRNKIDIPEPRTTEGPVKLYAHMDRQCMWDAHSYCAATYQNGRLFNLQSEADIQKLREAPITLPGYVWTGLYHETNTQEEGYLFIPCEPYNTSSNLYVNFQKERGDWCWHMHTGNIPEVHARPIGDSEPYICEETKTGEQCKIIQLMTSFMCHEEVVDVAACRSLCQFERNCWAILYILRTCFLLRNTEKNANAEIVMEEKECFEGWVSKPSKGVISDCTQTTAPRICTPSIKDSFSSTEKPLCGRTAAPVDVSETQNYVTVPATVYVTNPLTATITVTGTCPDSKSLETMQQCETRTLTVQQTNVEPSFVTVPETVIATNYLTVGVTITETRLEYITPPATRLCETELYTSESGSGFSTSTPTMSYNHKMSTTDTITSVDIGLRIEELKKILTVSRNSTRATKLKKVSVLDDRASALSIGICSLILVAMPFLCIFLTDISNLRSALRNKKRIHPEPQNKK